MRRAQTDIKSQYIANEIFVALPPELRTMTYSIWFNTTLLQSLYTDALSATTSSLILDPLPADITDSLSAYGFMPDITTLTEFLTPILQSYVSTLITPPPAPSQTKSAATGCEICDRSWIPLTYHHLIPRSTSFTALLPPFFFTLYTYYMIH